MELLLNESEFISLGNYFLLPFLLLVDTSD